MRKSLNNKAKSEINKAIEAFMNMNTQNAKFGRYCIENDTLSYRLPVKEEIRFKTTNWLKILTMIHSGMLTLVNYSIESLAKDVNDLELNGYDSCRAEFIFLRENIIAKRIPGKKVKFIVNSDKLHLIGRKVSFGKVQKNYCMTEIQKKLAKHMPMKSFTQSKEKACTDCWYCRNRR